MYSVFARVFKHIRLEVVVFSCVNVMIWGAAVPVNAFGPTGHRVIGRIAENHLTPRAKRAVSELLGSETLAQVSTWADEIRSDPAWDHSATWHYVTIEDDETYQTSSNNPRGDVIEAIERFTHVLRDANADREDKIVALRWLVHLVGDVHQPLHVGRGADRGGNRIGAKWFGEYMNMHAIWDEGLIESTNLSFSELAEFIDIESTKQIEAWQKSTIRDWAQESMNLRNQAYEVPEPSVRGSYKYAFKNMPLIKQRMLQAGVRLAGLLNNSFSDHSDRVPENAKVNSLTNRPSQDASDEASNDSEQAIDAKITERKKVVNSKAGAIGRAQYRVIVYDDRTTTVVVTRDYSPVEQSNTSQRVWDIVADFGGIKTIFPSVLRVYVTYPDASDTAVGTIRDMTFPPQNPDSLSDDNPLLFGVEQLTEFCDSDRRLTYISVLGLPVKNYRSVMEVTGDNGCELTWTSTFTPNPGQDGFAEFLATQILAPGANQIATALELP